MADRHIKGVVLWWDSIRRRSGGGDKIGLVVPRVDEYPLSFEIHNTIMAQLKINGNGNSWISKKREREKKKQSFFTFTHNFTHAVMWAVGLCDKPGSPRGATAWHRSLRVARVNLKFPIRNSSWNSNSVAFCLFSPNIVMATAVDVANTNGFGVSVFLSTASREMRFHWNQACCNCSLLN